MVLVSNHNTPPLALLDNCMPIDLELMVSMFLESTHSMEYANTESDICTCSCSLQPHRMQLTSGNDNVFDFAHE